MSQLKDDSYFKRYEDQGRNPAVLGPLRFMEFEHLRRPMLQRLSQQFADLACNLLDALPDDPELTKAIDSLRQAKDRAVGLAAVTLIDETKIER